MTAPKLLSATKQKHYWAIVHAVSGLPVLFDGRVPLYWLRSVAEREAKQRGFKASGSLMIRITRVTLSEVNR